jgi:hypothetical protein
LIFETSLSPSSSSSSSVSALTTKEPHFIKLNSALTAHHTGAGVCPYRVCYDEASLNDLIQVLKQVLALINV